MALILSNIEKQAERRAIMRIDAAINTADADVASKEILAAWQSSPRSTDVLTLAVYGLAERDRRPEAIDLLADAMRTLPPTETLLSLMAKIALDLELPELAKKTLEHAINLNPSVPDHYLTYAQCLHQMGDSDEAIGLLQSVLPQFPTNPDLWNLVGVITLQSRNNVPSARMFFKEAIQYNEKHPQAWANLAETYANRSEGLEYYERALELNPQDADLQLGCAMILLRNGQLQRAWGLYEARLSGRRGARKSLTYSHNIRRWRGEDIKRKTLLVTAEQGLGDEVLFAIFFKHLAAKVGQVVIGCDPRLIDIYERSFPEAYVVGFEDTVRLGERTRSFPQIENRDSNGKLPRIDRAIPIGSLPGIFWPSLDDLKLFSGGYLKADPGRVSEVGAMLGPKGNMARIGISWRSGNLSEGRKHGYMDLGMVKAIAAIPGIKLVNLQYDAAQEELEEIAGVAGERFVSFPNIDLKQDLEANLAIMANLDLVVGPSTATQSMAMAQGVETWCVHRGKPWWVFNLGNDAIMPFASNFRFIYINYAKNYRDASERRVVGEIEKWLCGRN